MDQNQLVAQLNRSSKVPLYYQLYTLLRGAILHGEWAPGTLIPPESELQQIYGVSQITVRQALDNLVNEGLIYRQRGRGTFVAQPAIEASLTRVISFTEDMRRRGCEPGSRVIFSGLIAASPTIAEKLQVEPGEELAQLNRLRFADGEPLSIERSSLVHRTCPGVLAGNFEQESLREVLRRDYGLQITRARQSIRAQNAIKEQATLLDIGVNSALLAVDRVSFSQHNIPVEYLQITYRADRYVLYAELQG